MGKKSAPPPAPDYTQAAEKTAQSSQDAQTRADWANRPEMSTPWGTSSWTSSAMVDPATGKPVTKWSNQVSLSGEQQKALDDQMAIQAGKSDIAQGMMGRLTESYQKPFDTSGLQAMGQGGGQAGGLNTQLTYGAGMGIQGGIQGAGQGIQGGVYGAGVGIPGQIQGAGQGFQGNVAGAGQGIRGFTPGAGRGMMNQLDPNLYGDQGRQRVENAMMERMAPQHQQAQAGLEGKLQNMGLTRGSEAWNREMQRLGDQQSRERFNALDRGLQEQQGQFGMAQGAGQFQNAAQAQQFGQRMQNTQMGNQAQQQAFGQNLQNAQFGNQANQDAFNQQMQNAQFGGQMQNQAFNQQVAAGQFGNQAQQQYYQQMLGAGQFGNQAQQQAFQQALGQNAQNFGQMQAASGQNFNQQMQQSEYQNRVRQQQIAEQLQQRAIPLNELNALLTGAQVATPGFQDFKGSQSAGGTNYSGAAQSQYNAGMDQYNAAQQQSQSMMSGIGQVAGMAGMMMMSDIRLKSNIERVGTHPLGVGVYEFDIQGQRERGVIAQEVLAVAPHLVHEHISGYLMVDYGGLQ